VSVKRCYPAVYQPDNFNIEGRMRDADWVSAFDYDALAAELAACRAENERLIDAQSREGRHALRVENERLRELLADCDTMLVGYSHLRATISEALGLGDESQDIVALIDRLRENAALKEPT